MNISGFRLILASPDYRKNDTNMSTAIVLKHLFIFTALITVIFAFWKAKMRGQPTFLFGIGLIFILSVILELFFIFGSQYLPNGFVRFSPSASQRIRARGIWLKDWRVEKPDYVLFRPNSIGFWSVHDGPDADFVSVFPTDENGLKNPRGKYTAADSFDIVTVGDSFTESTGVSIENSWAQLLAQKTGQSVYNLGGGGYGPSEQTALLRDFAFPKKPKIILWGFLEGNDLEDAVVWEQSKAAKAGTNPVSEWIDGILVLDFPFAVIRKIQYAKATQAVEAEGYSHFPTEHGEQFVPFNYYKMNERELTAYRGYEIFKRDFLLAKKMAQENGARLILVYFPNKAHSYFKKVSDEKKRALGVYAENIEAKRSVITKFCAENGVSMIDLTGPFQNLPDPQNHYFHHDGHMNARGNEKVAEVIAAYLSEAGR